MVTINPSKTPTVDINQAVASGGLVMDGQATPPTTTTTDTGKFYGPTLPVKQGPTLPTPTATSTPAPTASTAPAKTPSTVATPAPASPSVTTPVSTAPQNPSAVYDNPNNPNELTGYKDPITGKITYIRGTAPTSSTSPDAVIKAENTLTNPKSAYDYQTEAYNQLYPEYSGAISAITDSYSKLIDEANQQGTKNEGASRAQASAFGLMGSPEASTASADIAKNTSSAVAKLTNARNTEIANVIMKIHDNASQLAKEQANQDLASAGNVIALRDKAVADAKSSIETLAGSGLNVEDLQNKDPQTYNTLLDHLGGDPNMMKALFALGKPQASVLETKTVGSTMYQVTKDPVTGKVSTQSFDLGFTPPTEWKSSKLSANSVIFYDPTDPTKSVIKSYGGGAGGKGGYNPLDISRYTLASNRIVSNYIHLPGYKNLAGASSYLQRIEASKDFPGSVTDQELLDAVTQLNTGGNRVTEAQVGIITGGQSLSDWKNVMQKKILASGGVLSDDQRSQIVRLANEVYKKYQDAYKPIYTQASSQLENAGIPKAMWTIPDLNSLSTVGGSVNAMNAQDAKGSTMQPEDMTQASDLSSQIQEMIDAGYSQEQIDSLTQ